MYKRQHLGWQCDNVRASYDEIPKATQDEVFSGAKAFVKENKGRYECGGYIYSGEGQELSLIHIFHFTGSNVKNILRQYGFPDKERVFQVGTSNEYEQIFKRIIIELQRLSLIHL